MESKQQMKRCKSDKRQAGLTWFEWFQWKYVFQPFHTSLNAQEIVNYWTLAVGTLLLLLSRFSRVQLCATPETAAHQASPSLGFSKQEHWSGLPIPSPMHESEKWKWSRSVVSDSSDPMDCSVPGFYVHGIFQARVLGANFDSKPHTLPAPVWLTVHNRHGNRLFSMYSVS